jgi:hypothetical protein
MRIAISVVSVIGVAIIVVLLVRGGGNGGTPIVGVAAERPCVSLTDSTALAASLAVARRLRDEESAGGTVNLARHSIESDRVLARAVARGDAATARRRALVLLFNHEHIVRLRVLRHGRALADVGGRLVLTPLYAVLRVHGRAVGLVEFSVQDDMGYRLLALRLLGARVVMRYHGHTVMSDVHLGKHRLPRSGAVTIRGVHYLTGTIEAGRFPHGTLRITLLFRRPAVSLALALASCLQVRADILAAIVRRVYGETGTGPAVAVGRAAVRSSKLLPADVAGGHRKRARASARRLLRAGHLVRLRVVARGGRVLADVGTSLPVLGPVSVALRRHGRVVGRALLAVQSAKGFAGVASYLVGAPVLVRSAGRQLAGRVAGPASIPATGALSWHGVAYHVASFKATRFPSGSATVYVLVRDD